MYYGFLLLISVISPNIQVASLDNNKDSIVNDLKSSYSKWNAWYAQLSCKCQKSVIARPVGKPEIINPKDGMYIFKRNRDSILLETRDESRLERQVSCKVLSRNSRYSFYLARNDSSPWVVSDVSSNNDSGSESRVNTRICNTFLYLFSIPYKCYQFKPYELLIENNDEIISRKIIDGKKKCTITFNKNIKDSRGSLINTSFTFVFDEENSWCIEKLVTKTPKVTVSIDINYASVPIDGLLPPSKIVMHQINEGQGSITSEYSITDISRSALPEAEFQLSAYNLLEPAWLQGFSNNIPFPWFLYLTVAGVVFLLLASFILYRRGKKASA